MYLWKLDHGSRSVSCRTSDRSFIAFTLLCPLLPLPHYPLFPLSLPPPNTSLLFCSHLLCPISSPPASLLLSLFFLYLSFLVRLISSFFESPVSFSSHRIFSSPLPPLPLLSHFSFLHSPCFLISFLLSSLLHHSL